MPNRHRSPFGELLFRHRQRLGLSQRDVAERTFDMAKTDPSLTPVSERTVLSLERRTATADDWRTPRPSTARAIAKALGLTPGESDYNALLESVAATQNHDATMTGAGLSPRPFPPRSPEFVVEGREPHLARLRAAIDLAASGSAGAVFVGADPGTGKTWLVAEASREALERYPGTTVLWTQATERHGAAVACEPFQRMLSLMLGDLAVSSPRELLTDGNAAEIRRRLPIAARALIDDGDGLLHDLVPSESLRSPMLSQVVGAELLQQLNEVAAQRPENGHRAAEIYEAVYRVLTRYAAAGPVILVLEDLHWADEHTLATIAHLLTRLYGQRVPVLLIGTWRPGDPGSQDATHDFTLGSVLRMTPRLYPDALIDLSTAVGGPPGRAFVDATVARLSLPDPRPLAESLFDRTGGMPLFVMSILRLYDQEQRAGRSTSEIDLSDRIPVEVQSVFAEQLLRLPEVVQRLLEAASVQGMSFWAEVVMQMFGLSRGEFIDMVDSQLVRQFRMLLPGGTVAVASETAHGYQFSHALLRDVLYHRMTEFQRAHYHALTAEAIRDLYGPTEHEAVDQIALHFDRAGERLEAARAYRNAGDHAMERTAYNRALRHFRRIGELDVGVQDPAITVQALVGIGNCARGKGDIDTARATLTQASKLAQRQQLYAVQANALTSLGLLDFDAGHLREGASQFSAAIDAHLRGGNGKEAGRAMSNLSIALHGMGDYDEAMTMASRAIELATEHGDASVLASAQTAYANCWLDLGYYEHAIGLYDDCIALCEAHHLTHRANVCWMNIAVCRYEMQQWDVAQAAIDHVMQPDRGVVGRIAAVAAFNAGVVAEGKCDLTEARLQYQRSCEVRSANGQDALMIDSLAGLLRVAVAEGNQQLAATLMKEIQQRLDMRDLEGVEHGARLFLALIDASTLFGDEGAARKYIRQGAAYLTDRADRLAGSDHRASYLANPPAHRRIMALAAEHEVSIALGDANV